MLSRKLFIAASVCIAVVIFSFVSLPKDEAKSFHSPKERLELDKTFRTPIQSGEYFLIL
jgi:hypothetical protein